MSQQYQIPSTPRVTSPSPTPSENAEGSYFTPRLTRSAAAKRAVSSTIIEESEEERRARVRSRSPITNTRRRRTSGAAKGIPSTSAVQKSEPLVPNVVANGNLSPLSAIAQYGRDISRSPSPRFIPIHRSFRSFIHRHEIPRKILHVSIGFFTLHLYSRGYQTASIHPWLLGTVVPIASVDILRHNSPGFNRFYVRVLGAFMRESEVNDKYNGVIFYLLGAWVSMRFFPKDVAVMGVLLLSWCDTAASTVGRLYGRYTPRIRKGKSLAGSVAAALVGTMTSMLFWGYIVPTHFGIEDSFMFKGQLQLPGALRQTLRLDASTRATLTGWAALGVVSLWTGLVASLSEVVDLFGLDDNLTIPVMSGVGIWGFLRAFG